MSIKTLTGLFSGMYDAQTLANWGMLQGEPEAIAKGDCGVRDSVQSPTVQITTNRPELRASFRRELRYAGVSGPRGCRFIERTSDTDYDVGWTPKLPMAS